RRHAEPGAIGKACRKNAGRLARRRCLAAEFPRPARWSTGRRTSRWASRSWRPEAARRIAAGISGPGAEEVISLTTTHRNADKVSRPETHNQKSADMDSGLATSRRSGMTIKKTKGN